MHSRIAVRIPLDSRQHTLGLAPAAHDAAIAADLDREARALFLSLSPDPMFDSRIVYAGVGAAQRKAGRAGSLVREARYSIGADHQHVPREKLREASTVIHEMYTELAALRDLMAPDQAPPRELLPDPAAPQADGDAGDGE